MIAAFILVALLAGGAAAFSAYADGALLAVDDDPPPSSPAVALFADREAVHRALASARIVAQVAAGVAAAAAVRVSSVATVQVGPLVVGLGVLVVILAESAARSAGDVAGLGVLERNAAGIGYVRWLMRPVVAIGGAADRFVEALSPRRESADERDATVEQLREAVAEEAGVSREDESLLRGVFDLGDTMVQDILVPRVDVIGVDVRQSWAEILSAVRAAGHARYVAWDGGVDNVVGVLHAKDLLPAVLEGAPPAGGWQSLIRPAAFIPATKRVDEQLREFKASRRHLAVVVDEYGGTSGIVTLEDALEVMIGEIRDEHDVEEPDVLRDPSGRLSVSARLPVTDFAELVGEAVDDPQVHTVGGLMLSRLGRVPRVKESVRLGGHRLVADRVVRRRVTRVGVEPVDGSKAP